MVAPQQKEVLGILDLVRKQQAHGLNRLFSTVDVVPQEEVVGIWWEPSVLEQPEQIGELPVNVT